MRHHIIKLTILFTILFCSSCDDFLGIKPKSHIILTETRDYENLLNNYSKLKTVSTYTCFFTDDVFLPDTDPLAGLSFGSKSKLIQRLYKLEERPYTIAETDDDWGTCYEPMYTFNTIINEVLDSEGSSQAEKESVYAEALLARAYQYHQLLILYTKAYNALTDLTDPGLPLILEADVNKSNLERASLKVVYDEIIGDLKKAIKLLPDMPKNDNPFRGSKPAAQTLLARFYLYQGEYSEALILAEEALKIKSDLIDLNNYEVVRPDLTTGRTNVPEYKENKECVYIRYSNYSMQGSSYVASELIDLFDQENDQRFNLYLTKDYNRKKRDYYVWAPGINVNIGISTPEIYLIAAECQARLGFPELAMGHLNKLLEKRMVNFVPVTATDKDEALKLVLEERRKEFMMLPVFRLADIKRLGSDPKFAKTIERTVGNETIAIAPTSNRLVLHIPEAVIAFNPNMEQNNRNDE